jgi:hypothetical protein
MYDTNMKTINDYQIILDNIKKLDVDSVSEILSQYKLLINK